MRARGIDDKVEFPFNAVPFDNVKFPRQGSGLLHCKTDTLAGLRICCCKRHQSYRQEWQHGTHSQKPPKAAAQRMLLRRLPRRCRHRGRGMIHDFPVIAVLHVGEAPNTGLHRPLPRLIGCISCERSNLRPFVPVQFRFMVLERNHARNCSCCSDNRAFGAGRSSPG